MPVTPLGNPDFFLNVAASILASAADALECNGLSVPPRLYVGFDNPPQDCCPELVAWVTNVRTWDGDFPDVRQSGNLRMSWGYAFDVTLRIGRCYVDVGEDGEPLDAATLQDFSAQLYRDASALYMGWLFQWQAGNVTELQACDLVNVGAMLPYSEGGCAGQEFTITVGVFGNPAGTGS